MFCYAINNNFNYYFGLVALAINFILIIKIQQSNGVILTPPYFNLVSNKKVTATATCGENVREPELYCKLTGSTATDRETSNYANLIQGQYCDYCDPSQPHKSHHVSYAIDGTEKWWQSPPLSRSLEFNQVNLTIDLGQEFHVAYIYIKMANSPRPGVWALEKSTDYGKTYQTWQYFADTPSDCFNFFNTTANLKISKDDDVVCTTDYSKVLPVEGGEILLSLVNNRPNSRNFTHADTLQSWTRATNVRLRLIRTKNLLGHLMAVAKQDPTVTRRYFYSIRDISIGGRCVCNGHAQHCEASPESPTPDKLICRCSHNTCGDQCETCCDGFVQKKWRPNRENAEFECEPCQCYGHSNTCEYDPDIDEKKLSIDIHGNYEGGGVCSNCQHNTQGINCHECIPGYFRPFNVELTSPNACQKCDCDNEYSTGNCAQLTGECECKPQFSGRRCDECANGYTDWPSCSKCKCDINGRADSSCSPPCQCKLGYLGPFCDKCFERYYGFPNCTSCDCDKEGRLDWNCNQETGQCLCRKGYTGKRCDQCDSGYYAMNGDKMCTECNCDVGTTEEICHKNNGTCICGPNFAGERCNECAPGFYNFPSCLPCECDVDGSINPSCSYYGTQPQCNCKKGRSGPRCDMCAPGFYKYPECIACECDEAGTIGQSCDPFTGKCNCKSNFAGEKCSECGLELYNYPVCEPCTCHPDGTKSDFPGCNKDLRVAKIVCPCKDFVHGSQCEKCKDRYYSLGSDVERGCSPCECNRDGTLNELDVCNQLNGQCHCKLFVDASACNECKRGFFSLKRNNIFGCESCECLPGSSLDNYCDKVTGQCQCLPHINGLKCDEPEIGYYVPDLHQLRYEIENGYSKNGKSVRYDFDASLFANYTWKGYVHLNKVQGEISQNVSISKPGTFRMIVRYLNLNSNITELFIRVRNRFQMDEEQNATLYLTPNQKPSFETVTVRQISALILELEATDYVFSFESKVDNFYLDHFVLLPSDYFESTVLADNIDHACKDLRDKETCVQYKYASIERFGPQKLDGTIDLDKLKEFNHTYEKPLMVTLLEPRGGLTKTLQFPPQKSPGDVSNSRTSGPEYVLLVDFVNTNLNGKELQVDITNADSDSNKKQSGRVFLYNCNLTTLCREVLLSKDFNEPLVIKGKNSADFKLSLQPSAGDNGQVMLYQVTLMPKEKFNVNHIKMAPYCIVKNKQCLPLEYPHFQAHKIDLETFDNNGRQDLFRPSQSGSVGGESQTYEYIPKNKIIYLNNYFPQVTVPVRVPYREPSDHVLIIHYYQPNHPNVDVSVFLDKNRNASFSAPYCPSTKGCRTLIKFESNTETFNDPDINSLSFQLTENGKDIWLDHVLLTTAKNVDTDMFEYMPLDLTNDFIEQCASQHFNIEYYSSEMCDKSVLSLSSKYNGGALSCNCDPDGSKTTAICDYLGGQCQCKENIIGRECSRCKTGYFGFPECKPCDCPTGNCDDITGKCVLAPFVDELKGNECVDGYYGFHPIMGCDECDCESEGTQEGYTKLCDKSTGQCKCKENMQGLRCDQCKAGYYDHPRCYDCGCNRDGAISDVVCDSKTATCLCKENVDGERCDYCKQGMFNLEDRNAKGCTQCFCFGLTQMCRSSDLFVGSERDMNEWSLAYSIKNSNESDIKVAELDDNDGSLKLKFNEAAKLNDPFYWSAPKSYLGNKVTSYGGKIKYSIKIGSGTGSTIRPDLLLVGRDMTLTLTSMRQPAPNEQFTNEIDLLETIFSHYDTGSTVTREQFMIVLSNLVEVKLRATYYTTIHESELINFEMDTGQAYDPTKANRAALSVEQCYCPANYRGYSCESCEDGYYKVKGNGPGLFSCVPCNCNGHADTCDQDTGECLNCRDNTLGKKCEQCKTGYHLIDYGNGQTECRLCPCPGPTDSNIFADSCMFDYTSNKVFYCQCKPGYSGQFCERCAPGYYGDPSRPGGKCLPCECNNNIDMNDYGACDQRTGACLKCLNNTAGASCEKCAYWHYGDPIVLKSCKPCDCDRCGSSQCDAKTGECSCHKNVQGYNCASCGENMWGFSDCQGCNECNCDPMGSTSTQCNVRTGECSCKPGVGGKQCNQCLSDHWDFKDAGCQKCQCQTAGVQVTNTGGFSCNSTSGYCTCIEGVMGKLCDECKPRWVLVKHVGCKKCDTCVHTLLDDVEMLFVKADGIESGNKDSSLTFKAHNKLVKLENEFNLIESSMNPSEYESTPLLNLQREIKRIQDDLKDLKLFTQYDLSDKIANLTTLLDDANSFNKEINELRIKLDILDGIINDLDSADMSDLKNVTDEQLNLYENIVDQIIRKDFSLSLDKYKKSLDEFKAANETVLELKNTFTDHTNQIESIKSKNDYIQKSLAEVKFYIDKAKNLDNFKEKDVEFKAYFDNLDQIKNETSKLQANTAETLNVINKLIDEGESKLKSSTDDLSSLNNKVESLQSLYTDHEEKYKSLKEKCSQGEKNAQSMASIGQTWQNKVMNSQNGLVAFEMAMVYEKIANNLNHAYNTSLNTLKEFTVLDENLDDLIEKTNELKTKSESISKSTDDELARKSKAEVDHNNLNAAYSDLNKKAKNLTKNLEKIDQWINKTFNSDQTLNQLRLELENQQIDLNTNEEKANDLVRKIQSLDTLRASLPRPSDQSDDSNNEIPNGEQMLKSIENSIDSLREKGPQVNATVKKLLEENNFNSELERISKDIYDLKILIESTRQIANDIKVAVNFNDTTVINLKSPMEIQPSMSTSSSIYLKTREVYAPIALIYNESKPNEYLSLYINQGRPHLHYKLSSEDETPTILSTDVPINNGQWHKIQVNRVGKLAKLKVSSEYGEQENEKMSNDDSIVFNMDANGAKFILGQFPFSQLPNDLKTIAAYNNQFRGSMDAFKFNDHSLGLWNYMSAKNLKGEINRKYIAKDDQNLAEEGGDGGTSGTGEQGIYFMEDSFMCLKQSAIRFNSKSRIDLTVRFKTQSSNGILWIWYNDEKQYLSVYLDQGHLNVAFILSSESKLVLFDRSPSKNSYRLDDNKFHTIKITIQSDRIARSIDPQNPYSITMSVEERIDQETENKIDEIVHKTNRLYSIRNGKQCIGGLLATDRENIFKDAQFNSFSGCLVSLTTTNNNKFELINLQETLHDPGTKAHNVVPNCPGKLDQCEIKKSDSPVFLQFDVSKAINKMAQDEIIGISFVTTNPDGLLFFRKQETTKGTNKYILELKDSKLHLTINNGEKSVSLKTKTSQQYNDNSLHVAYIVHKKIQSLIELRVDNELADSITFESTIDAGFNSNNLYIAGVPSLEISNLPTGKFDNFEGCIIQLIYNKEELELAKADSRSNSIKFAKCYKTQIRSALLNIPGYKELQNTVQLNRFSQTVKLQQEQNTEDSLKNEECLISKQYDTSQLRFVGLRFGLTKQSRLEVHDTFPIKISTHVSFKFRTLQPDGLMFYASDAIYSDFISVWLQGGYVNFAFDCGSGLMHIKSKRIYSDGRYHTVTVSRDKQNGVLILSDRSNSTITEQIEDQSVGEANSLSVVEPYFFGNLPNRDKTQLPTAQSDLLVSEPFVGCMSDFKIAFKQLRKNLQNIDIMNCSNNHESGLFFTGHSMTNYAKLTNYLALKDLFEISFEIKSRTKNGVLMFIGDKDDMRSYALVEMVNGQLFYKLNLNGIENQIKYTPELRRNELCSSNWIRIKVKKDDTGAIGLEVKGVEVDANTNNLSIQLNKKLINQNTILYLGALPSRSSYAEITQTNEPYIGCMRDLMIKRNDDDPLRALLELSTESGVLNYCPLK